MTALKLTHRRAQPHCRRTVRRGPLLGLVALLHLLIGLRLLAPGAAPPPGPDLLALSPFPICHAMDNAPAPDAPVLYLVETDPTGGVVGVDTDGTLRRLVGTGWENVGTTTGTVQALGVTGDGAIVLVDDRGVVWIRDTTATVLIPAATP